MKKWEATTSIYKYDGQSSTIHFLNDAKCKRNDDVDICNYKNILTLRRNSRKQKIILQTIKKQHVNKTNKKKTQE
jgi:hypothetical protein